MAGFPRMMLTPEQLQERLKAAEVRFNAAKIEKDKLSAQLEAADNECMRIQGEYRALKAMIEEAVMIDAHPQVRVKNEGELASDAPTDSLEEQRKAAKKEAK